MTAIKLAGELNEFVLHDPRYRQLGLRKSACHVFLASEGVIPTPDQVAEVLHQFWLEFDARNPSMTTPDRPPIGQGSPYYVLDELSPWQENAIRILEEQQDA